MSEASSELEQRDSVELVQFETAKDLAELLSGIRQAAEPTEEELEAMRFAIVFEMASAETEEEMWKEVATWNVRDNVDRAFEVRDARAWRSKYVNPRTGARSGAFLSCPAIDLESGELGILNTSAMRVCGRIGWYKVHRQLPVRLRIVVIGESGQGFPIYDARRIEEPVVADGVVDGEVIEDAELVDA